MSKHTMNVNVLGVSWEVEYDYFPGSRGSSEYPGGPPIEPDDPGEIEVIAITSEDDLMELLGESTIAAIQESVEDNHSEVMASEAADYADYLNDCARDREYERKSNKG